MAKIVIQHDIDPAIGIVLEYIGPDDPRSLAQGWRGCCTECGWPMHRWFQGRAVEDARAHVDSHVAQVQGVDPSSVVGNPAVDHEFLVGCNTD
jgi:hypothetical protein